MPGLRITILGLTITSSWGNGHATTYRGLVRGLARRGHDVLFLECDKPWYRDNRDLPEPPWGTTRLYRDVDELEQQWLPALCDSDLIIVGSYVPDGIRVGKLAQWAGQGVVAFYDIDTPVTLAALDAGRCEYLTPIMLLDYALYLSFTGGPTLAELERRGAPMARALYCSADPETHRPMPEAVPRWDLNYLGTYSDDRQLPLDQLLCEPARRWPEGRFCVAGPQYPETIIWPANVARTTHLAPDKHRRFYAESRWTLNVTRVDMIRRGWSPSVRLFEAACCGVPVISDRWEGLDHFFRPGEEIVIADDAADSLAALRGIPEQRRRAIAERARAKVLAAHTGDHRALELEGYYAEVLAARSRRRARA